MRTYDCFTFFNELDMLEMRLEILNNHVDYFVLVESTKTHSGKDKELVFEKNKVIFERFSKKIIHVVVDNMPEATDQNRWILENFQRNAIMRGLSACDPEDIILISDVDEIPRLKDMNALRKDLTSHNGTVGKKELLYSAYMTMRAKLSKSKSTKGLINLFKKITYRFPIKTAQAIGFKQNFYYYYLNGFINADWIGTKAVMYGDLVNNFNLSPQQVRESSAKHILGNGGWHFSYLLTPEEIAKKIQAFAHSEFDTKEFTDTESIKKRIANGEDLFGRKEKITYKPIDESYPEYIRDNLLKYDRYIHAA